MPYNGVIETTIGDRPYQIDYVDTGPNAQSNAALVALTGWDYPPAMFDVTAAQEMPSLSKRRLIVATLPSAAELSFDQAAILTADIINERNAGNIIVVGGALAVHSAYQATHFGAIVIGGNRKDDPLRVDVPNSSLYWQFCEGLLRRGYVYGEYMPPPYLAAMRKGRHRPSIAAIASAGQSPWEDSPRAYYAALARMASRIENIY